MTAGTMPPGRSSAYVEMLSTGALRLIRADELRGALVDYDEAALENRDIWLSLRDSLTPVMPTWLRSGITYSGRRLKVLMNEKM